MRSLGEVCANPQRCVVAPLQRSSINATASDWSPYFSLEAVIRGLSSIIQTLFRVRMTPLGFQPGVPASVLSQPAAALSLRHLSCRCHMPKVSPRRLLFSRYKVVV